ncbi:type II toxin-antitoxin system VapC family toxin [Frankia sp. Cr1]|uniref:type II toxin-antitoxin system VapC family toxin n=1 Tax=Frankia sp. Cr1 TaxID=3073931 RepID=UPI002AD460BF|nr:type II toxin-antitoxin system VapC family toxin [Frankia sp. Cr1]
MAIVVDTSVLIDHLRGDQDARDALREAAAAGERLAASVLTKVEILAGMRKGEERVTRRLLDSLDLIGVDDVVAERAGMLANQYLRSHPGVDPVDYVIAATAQQLGAKLWTRNLKHFPMFSGLSAPY